MKFIVVCDEKPSKCEDCPIYYETLAETDKKNEMAVVSQCFLTGVDSIEDCPLTEVKTLFTVKES